MHGRNLRNMKNNLFKRLWNSARFWKIVCLLQVIAFILLAIAFNQAIQLTVELYGMIP